MTDSPSRWQQIAEQVLDGQQLTRDEGLDVLDADPAELLDLMAAAFRVRREHFGIDVQLYYLENAKSGLCPEDCSYCSQSAVAETPIDRYRLKTPEQLVAGARQAAKNQARTYCIVASGRAPSDADVDQVAQAVRDIKQDTGLHICCCLGLLDPDQARRLKQAGVDRINHNLNTSRGFYDEICSTHSYQERIDTLKACREQGLELCCGLIVGMGETHDDVVDVCHELQELGVESIPVNFLNPIDGTPLENTRVLDPVYCLKVLALFRFAHPRTEIRIAGGREVNLRSLQPLGLYAANSLFVSDYLTTPGQDPSEDHSMIQDLGFHVVQQATTPASA